MRSIEARLVVVVVVAIARALAVPVAAHAGGDAAAGKRKGLACAACHGSSDPASDLPRLAGQHEAYLAGQLRAFRRGERANPLMDEIARQLSDADIEDVAAFWSGQPPGSDFRPSPEVTAIERSHMGFPRGFPRGFVLYLTANDAERNEVKQHYINAIGLEAARSGKPLPDGSVVIQVHYRARLGDDHRPVVDSQGAWAVDGIASYAGMEARAGWGSDLPVWLRNANWSYASFAPDRTPRVDVNLAVCLACHKRQALVSHLFTFNELWDAARAK